MAGKRMSHRRSTPRVPSPPALVPSPAGKLSAPARAALTRQRLGPALARELNQLEADLGGRAAVITLLTSAPISRDPELAYLVGQVCDPAHDHRQLGDLCRDLPVALDTLYQALRHGALARAHVVATKTIADRLPAVVADVMRKGAPYEDHCTICQGTGSTTPDPTPEEPNPSPQPCEICRGTGRLLYDADPKRQDRALELGGLLARGGGTLIQIQQQQQIGALFSGRGQPPGALEILQAAADDVLYGDSRSETPTERAIDATVVVSPEGNRTGSTPAAPSAPPLDPDGDLPH